MNRYLAVAIEAARTAGSVHKKYFQTSMRICTKKTSYDRLTIADLEAEKRIVSIIKKHFPDHNILAEENKYPATDSPYTWIIDPLDGTNNFSHGFPIFCASVALAKQGRVIAGAIYDVTRDELFTAQKNKGAFLNGKRIRVVADRRLDESLLITGFYYDRGKDMKQNLTKIRLFFHEHIIGLRRLGAAALDLCYVACGRATGFWEFELSPWDFAAGKLLIEEAGGRVSDRNARPLTLHRSFVVASNQRVHKAMLAILQNDTR